MKVFISYSHDSVEHAERVLGLAKRVQQENALLVLDGVEPLQYPKTHRKKESSGLDGRLKDNNLKTLLKDLARGSGGLCVITSRQWLTDLEDFSGDCRGVNILELDHLTLGRARHITAQESGKEEDWKMARQSLDRAVEGLRKSGYQDSLILGLLARAWFFRARGEFDKAREDLRETLEIAEAGEMRRFIADYHLEAARLALALSEVKKSGRAEELRKAGELLRGAEKMIGEMGYRRRVKEVEELKKKLKIKK